MKPRVLFTVADKRNEWMVEKLINSVRKFHSEEELPVIVYDQEKLDKIADPYKFYRATPMFARELIKEYELVIKIDCDSIVTGSLDPVFDLDFDVATVYNWNRIDPLTYGEIGIATISPIEYFNCGFVAMRSKEFIDHWWGICNSVHFDRMPMREQGFLNILTHYGTYNTVCLDDARPFYPHSWWGLRSKGEWNKIVLIDGKMILPVGADGYPEGNKEIRVIHFAGGSDGPKMNYGIYFNEECIKHLDWLTGGKNGK